MTLVTSTLVKSIFEGQILLEIHPKGSRFKQKATVPAEPGPAPSYDTFLADFRGQHGQWLAQTLQALWAKELTGDAFLEVESEIAECLFYKREPYARKHVCAPTIRYLLDVFRAERLGGACATQITIANAPSRQKSRAGIKRGEPGRGVKLQVTTSDITGAVGVEKWELALVFLREAKAINIAAQDSRKLATLLMQVNAGNAVLPRFFNGNGSLVYGLTRLKSMFTTTKYLVMECTNDDSTPGTRW